MSYTQNLDDYVKMPETSSCYLDGRYFNKVLLNYPGLIYNPLNIIISENRKSNKKKVRFVNDLRVFVDMKAQTVETKFPGLLRVVITTSKSRHSNLLIIDYENGIVHRFEPLGRSAPYFDKVNEILEEYLSYFLDIELKVIDIDLDSILDEKNPTCLARGERSGFCTAYILLYAYAYLNGKEFNPEGIRRFAKKIESNYGTLPMEGKEIEYGIFTGSPNPDQGRNMLIGGLAGAALGGVVGGGAGGLVLGGLGGAAIGGII